MKPAADRFWSMVRKSEGCWVWLGCTTNTGYGRFSLPDRTVLAHRFGYELQKGAIPEGLTIDHLCLNKQCVRGEHLEAVTMAENGRRRGLVGVGRVNAQKTHCPRGHALAGDNLRPGMRPGNRSCKKCSVDLHRGRRAAKRANAVMLLIRSA